MSRLPCFTFMSCALGMLTHLDIYEVNNDEWSLLGKCLCLLMTPYNISIYCYFCSYSQTEKKHSGNIASSIFIPLEGALA